MQEDAGTGAGRQRTLGRRPTASNRARGEGRPGVGVSAVKVWLQRICVTATWVYVIKNGDNFPVPVYGGGL